MSGHAKRYPKAGGDWCHDCHEFGGVHAVGCPSDDMDEDFDPENAPEPMGAFDFINAGNTEGNTHV